MIINKIIINHFGKLKNFTLDFNDGFTMIYGDNEQGKSTIMAFIRMMLYGTVNRSLDLNKNMRKKYLPWDGSKMSGALEFTHENQLFRIEKTFGATPKSDIVKLWNQTTSKEENLNEQKDIGRRFLGLGETAFEKSVFIGQIGSVIMQEKDDENEIIQRLQNLASSGDETQSFDLVDSRLDIAMSKIYSKRGKIGILDKLMQDEQKLSDAITISQECESKKTEMQNIYESLLLRKETLQSQLFEKNSILDEIKRFREYEEYLRIINKNKSVENLQNEQNKYDNNLTNGDFTVNLSFIEEASKQFAEYQRLKDITELKKKDYENLIKMLNDEKFKNASDIPKDDFDNVSKIENELLELNEEINLVSSNISHFEYDLKESEFLLEQKKNLENKIADNKKLLQQTKNIYENELNEESNKSMYGTKIGNKSITPIVIVFILAMISFVAMGFLISTYLFAGALIPIIGTIILILKDSNAKQINREMIGLQSENLQKIHAKYQAIMDLYENTLKGSLYELNSFEIKNKEKETSENIILKLANEQSKINGFNDNKQKISEHLKSVYEKHNLSSYSEFQAKYIQSQNIENQKNNLVSDLSLKNKDYLDSQKNLDVKTDEILFLIAKIKTVASIDEGKALIDDITPKFYESQSHRTALDEKKKDLRLSLNGMQLATVIEKFEEIKDRYENNPEKTSSLTISNDEFKLRAFEIENIKNDISLLENDITRKQTELTHMFSDVPELATVLDLLKYNKQQQDGYKYDYEIYKIAKETLENSFTEMQLTFGPIVNSRTGNIFSKLTNNKYSDLLVTKDLSISFRDPEMNITMDWQYLSSGTIDQVYFSLRLAISEFLSKQVGGLPLFLDDAFLQYDDFRVKKAISFLEEYAVENKMQIIFFTCHRLMIDCCNDNVIVKEI